MVARRGLVTGIVPVAARIWSYISKDGKRLPPGRTAAAAATGAGMVLWLAACATPYQPVGFLGGYRELPFSDDTVLVSFHWMRFTPPERIADFLLLRGAEIALGRGAPYFVVLEASRELQSDLLRGTLAVLPTPHPSAEVGPLREAREVRLLEDPRTVGIRIRLLKDTPAPGSPAMDAARVRAELRAKYSLGT